MPEPSADAVLDALPSEVVLLVRRGRIRAANAAWRAFSDQNDGPDASWVGTDYLGVCMGPDGGDAARAGIQAVLDGTRDRFQLEYPCHGPDEKRWFEMRVTRLPPPHDDRVVVSHDNVTDRHRAEEARRERWEGAMRLHMERERSEFMREFLNEVSHEVRTPLSLLRFHCDQVAQEVQEVARGPLTNIERALSGVEATARALAQAPRGAVVDLADLARDLEDLVADGRRRDVSFRVDLPGRGVRAPEPLTGQLLTLLAQHVLAGCPSGGGVDVDAVERPGLVEVRVTGDAAAQDPVEDLWMFAARHLAGQANLPVRQESLPGPRTRVTLRLQGAPRSPRPAPSARPRPAEVAAAAAAPASRPTRGP